MNGFGGSRKRCHSKYLQPHMYRVGYLGSLRGGSKSVQVEILLNGIEAVMVPSFIQPPIPKLHLNPTRGGVLGALRPPARPSDGPLLAFLCNGDFVEVLHRFDRACLSNHPQRVHI